MYYLKFFLFYIGVQLIKNIVLVLVVQQSVYLNIYIYIYIYKKILFQFFSHLGYYGALSRVSCAIQRMVVGYLFQIQQCARQYEVFKNKIKQIWTVSTWLSHGTPFNLPEKNVEKVLTWVCLFPSLSGSSTQLCPAMIWTLTPLLHSPGDSPQCLPQSYSLSGPP